MKLPFIISSTCLTGSFQDTVSDCFGEIWLKAQDKGAIAFVGATRTTPEGTIGGNYPDSLLCWNGHFLIGVIEAIMNDNYEPGDYYPGKAVHQGKKRVFRKISPEYGNEYRHRINIAYNILGDPAIEIWTDTLGEIVLYELSPEWLEDISTPQTITSVWSWMYLVTCYNPYSESYQSTISGPLPPFTANFTITPQSGGVFYITATRHNAIPSVNEIRVSLNPPTGLTATIENENSVYLTWEDNSFFETGYQIERRREDEAVFSVIDSVSANQNFYIDETVECGFTYYYRVRADGGDYFSNYSNEVSVNLFPPPQIISIQAQYPWSSVIINWNDVSTCNDGYEIERVDEEGNVVSYDITDPNAVSFTDSDVERFHTYKYRIRAYMNEGGNLLYSDWVETVAFNTPHWTLSDSITWVRTTWAGENLYVFYAKDAGHNWSDIFYRRSTNYGMSFEAEEGPVNPDIPFLPISPPSFSVTGHPSGKVGICFTYASGVW